jgi:UDP-GlcNAc:undecaprenyl-phosphate GlcNAc-1-phosphate transferase
VVAYVLLFATAALSSAALSPALVRLGHRVGALDRPGGRKVHLEPVPRLGGVAIALALTLALGVSMLLEVQAFVPAAPDPRSLLPTIAGAVLVFAVGLWDDIDPVGPMTKVTVEAAAAVIVVGAGIAIRNVTLFGNTFDLGLLAIPLTVFWILVVTNAFNLMDGLDGLAAGLAAIAAMTCAAVLLARDERAGALLLVSLVGAILGFVAYNFYPAKIFLGDCGSLLVGFLLSVTAIMGQQKSATTLAVGVPLLIFALPIVDTSLAVTRRLAGGRRNGGAGLVGQLRGVSQVFKGDRSHIHHRLLDFGFSHRRTVLLLYALASLLSGLALLTMQVP